ncbi:hypothetical protein R4U18_002258 [Salmonella enterica]|nr:hypothetical protein [Salmonella enterica]
MTTTKKAKAAVRGHQRLSGAKITVVAGGIMAKNPRYYHTDVHKNITRDRFIRSVNPIVADEDARHPGRTEAQGEWPWVTYPI